MTPTQSRRRDNSRFGAGGTYTCRSCDKLTRETGEGESSVDLCLACYNESGLENEHLDGFHDEVAADGCLHCQEGS